MEWNRDLIERLADNVPGGYAAGGEPTTEPTALAGLALVAHRRRARAMEVAQLAAEWLANQQAECGSVGISPDRPTPCWPTSLAIVLWHAVQSATGSEQFAASIARAVQWALAERGRTQKQGALARHDTTLTGWSWAANTHSWIEPTAMFVLALKAVGEGGHPRTREATQLIADRLLPGGGCNYGNTIVLGQTLLPHVQPTGLAMMALAGEDIDDPRIELSLTYLQRELRRDMTTASLCYGLVGLAAHNRRPVDRLAWLERAHRRTLDPKASCYKLALVALAAADSYPFAHQFGSALAHERN